MATRVSSPVRGPDADEAPDARASRQLQATLSPSCLHLVITLVSLAGLLASTVFSLSAIAESSRPFWTEQSTFVQGDELFVVGVATRARTQEEGRRLAFENGRQEILNYGQLRYADLQSLVIETQMTFEEPNPDGTYTVFRLLHVPLAALKTAKESHELPPPPPPPPAPVVSEPAPCRSDVKRYAGVSIAGAIAGGLLGWAATLGSPVGLAIGAGVGAGFMGGLTALQDN